MSKPDHLPTITDNALVTATGGATRSSSSSSSNDWQLQQTMQSITDSLSDLKNNNNNNCPLQKMLPLMVAAKVMRDRNSGY
jgi:hypothetical protein